MMLLSPAPVSWYTLLGVGLALPLILLIRDIAKWYRLPPGPLPIPFIGNRLPALRPWVHLQQWSKIYGPIFTIWVGRQPTIVISDPKIAVDLMEKRSSKYSSRPRSVMMKEVYGSSSILLQPYGKDWSTRRRLYHLGLTPAALRSYKGRQQAEATRLAFHILHEPDRWERALDRFAASVVFSIAYGHRIDSLDCPVVRDRLEIIRFLATLNTPGRYMAESFPILKHMPNFVAPWEKYIQERGMIEATANMALVEEVKRDIRMGKENGTEAAPSLTQNMLAVRDNEGLQISDRDLSYIPSGLFGAGSDTAASTLCSTILALVTHPGALEAAQAEIDSEVGCARMPTFEDEERLPYIRALVKEVLRWRPVAVLGGTPHATTGDDIYRGWYIPGGTAIMSNTWAMNLDEDYYPNPHLFNPARFLSESDPRYAPELKGKKTHPAKNSLSSFGWGRRYCVGADLALNSLFIALSKMIWAFDILPTTEYCTLEYTTVGSNIRPQPFECQIRIRSDRHRRTLEGEKVLADQEMEKFPAYD
ncbi:uncharacterized protein BP5553_00549 [Venustampulla echinocandica]|uniref:Cytochrome P450 n=1 Tax=Venustampulla echinocandica TaxID=2656787 RepID=A0A370TYH7_9HELO|nr:uncharacterized protein BP5553_00549 [Venustampulla echinocandica]RDL40570.1 hypothetical protein BP5553_00549 [Venustampulla echinocandica]